MGEKVFVGVDEYDAPANACLFERAEEQSKYLNVTAWFKTQLFSVLKSACSDVVEKYWLTGVLPVFRDGISPLSQTVIISRMEYFNSCCGLTEDEVRIITSDYLTSTHADDDISTVIQDMKMWYGGYRFCPPTSASSVLYNPHAVFAHLSAVGLGSRPQDQFSSTHSDNALKAISKRGDVSVDDFLPLLSSELGTEMATAFGVDDVQQVGHRASITWGLLYHYGVITQSEKDGFLVIPNRSMRILVCPCRWQSRVAIF
jgi:hypothetical protein